MKRILVIGGSYRLYEDYVKRLAADTGLKLSRRPGVLVLGNIEYVFTSSFDRARGLKPDGIRFLDSARVLHDYADLIEYARLCGIRYGTRVF